MYKECLNVFFGYEMDTCDRVSSFYPLPESPGFSPVVLDRFRSYGKLQVIFESLQQPLQICIVSHCSFWRTHPMQFI
jgi:hypothetical protein